MSEAVDTAGWAIQVPIGYRVGGWEVVRPIATGSWASVYEGRRVDGEGGATAGLPDRVALKFLPTGTLTPRQLGHLNEMAARELRAHRKLRHPRLIGFHHTLVVDDPGHPELDGAAVIVMERAAASLADALARAAGGPVPDAARYIVEICEGLAYLHGKGWIHGDLKPSNVLVMADGSVRLADFGLAAELDGTHAYLPPGGSLGYMAPERWDEPLTEHGTRYRTASDVWALGVTAYQLLSGRMPFPGASPRARAAQAARYAAGHDELLFPTTVPPGWREWLADCLAPDPARRPGAAELLARARRLAADPARARVRRRPRRRREALGKSLAMALGMALAWPVTPGAGRPADLHLRADSDVPAAYRDAIIAAAYCRDEVPEVTPALLAASLKALSDFDPSLTDPAKDEYGIARWTPRVLWHYLPERERPRAHELVYDPYVSIHYMGTYICTLAPRVLHLAEDPLDRQILAATIFQSNTRDMISARGVPPYARWYADKVREYLPRYTP
nr:MAG: protein kinase [Actinomycetota bacterium]